MLKARLLRKQARLPALMTVAILLIAVFAPGALAFNYNGSDDPEYGGNKPFDFNGYEYVDRTHIKIFFNKSTTKSDEFDAGQFTVKRDSDDHNVVVSSMAETTGSGCSDYRLTQGTTQTLTLSENLDYDTLYRVIIDAQSVADDNYISLGNYRYNEDFTFYFRTPDSIGVYSTTYAPKVSYTLDTNQTDSTYDDEEDVAYEHNLGVCFDRPMYNDSTTISNFLSSLSTNYTMTGNGSGTVAQDSTVDSTYTTDGQCYTPHANDVHTFFFFPQTVNQKTNAVYNRFSTSGVTYSYRLALPNFTQYGNNKTWSSSDAGYAAVDQFDFDSAGYDQVGWLDTRPSVSGSGANVTVTWSASGIIYADTPAADRYDLYRSTNRWDPGSLIYSDINGTSQAVTLPGSGTYYFRVVPKDSSATYGDAGYSVPSEAYSY